MPPIKSKPAAQTTAAARRSKDTSPLLDTQLCFALYSASLAMTKLYRPMLAAIDLTYPQYLVMLTLWETDNQTVGALGNRLSLDSGTLTPLLKRMESLGLVHRTRGTTDERQVCITLTETGSALQGKANAIHERVACSTGCTAKELSGLTQSLQELRASLQLHIGT